MNKVFKCPICSTQFDTSIKTPLTLPCGDVICRECIQVLLSKSHPSFTCPIDKSTHSINLQSLPICQTILQYLPQRKPKEFLCKKHHGKEIKYLCSYDNEVMCSKCLGTHSIGPSHKISQFSPTKAALLHEVNFITERITERLHLLKSDYQLSDEYKNVLLNHTKDELRTLDLEFNRIVSQLTSIKNRLIDKVNHVLKYQIEMIEMKERIIKEQQENYGKMKEEIEGFVRQMERSEVIYEEVIEIKKNIIQQWEKVLKKMGRSVNDNVNVNNDNSNNKGCNCIDKGIVLPKIFINNTKSLNDYCNLFIFDTIAYQTSPVSMASLKNTNVNSANNVNNNNTNANEDYTQLRINTNPTSNHPSDYTATKANTNTNTNTQSNGVSYGKYIKSSGSNSNSNINSNSNSKSEGNKRSSNIITNNRRKFSEPTENNNSQRNIHDISYNPKSNRRPVKLNQDQLLIQELTKCNNRKGNSIEKRCETEV